MKVKVSDETKKRAILIAENKDDLNVLRFLFLNKCVYGYYLLWQRPSDTEISAIRAEISYILSLVNDSDTITGIAFLHAVNDVFSIDIKSLEKKNFKEVQQGEKDKAEINNLIKTLDSLLEE